MFLQIGVQLILDTTTGFELCFTQTDIICLHSIKPRSQDLPFNLSNKNPPKLHQLK